MENKTLPISKLKLLLKSTNKLLKEFQQKTSLELIYKNHFHFVFYDKYNNIYLQTITYNCHIKDIINKVISNGGTYNDAINTILLLIESDLYDVLERNGYICLINRI